MPIDAVTLDAVENRERLAASIVFEGRDRFEVLGIDTPPIATQMVYVQSGGNGADHNLVDDSMRISADPVPSSDAAADLAVTVAIVERKPFPAVVAYRNKGRDMID